MERTKETERLEFLRDKAAKVITARLDDDLEYRAVMIHIFGQNVDDETFGKMWMTTSAELLRARGFTEDAIQIEEIMQEVF